MTAPGQDTACWCCGSVLPEQQLVQLGEHPEVSICLECTTFLGQRAGARRDELRPGAAARARQSVRGVRGWVIDRQVHRWPVVGPLLKHVNRHLP